jgi:hypothetical protein
MGRYAHLQVVSSLLSWIQRPERWWRAPAILGIISAATSTRTQLNRLHLILLRYRSREGRSLKFALSEGGLNLRAQAAVWRDSLRPGCSGIRQTTLEALIKRLRGSRLLCSNNSRQSKAIRHYQSLLRKQLHMRKRKRPYITALWAAKPELINIATGKESRPVGIRTTSESPRNLPQGL